MERYGEETVENFIDSCLSLENLIDIHSPFIKRRDDAEPLRLQAEEDDEDATSSEVPEQGLHGLVRQPARRPQGAGQKQKEAEKQKAKQFPEHPERDVLLFLLEHAPLNAWQRDVLEHHPRRRRTTSPRRARPRS